MSNDANRMRYVRIACVLGGLAVIAGAFGAHGLKSRIDADHLGYWQTAVQYHFYHALALLAFASGARPVARRASMWACRAWMAGIAIFSGTLYMMAVTDQRWLGAITPFGGLALIAGWGLAAISVSTTEHDG
jgi:uncharacterized membrane protein YgdD (TMEM256/DUF423 family)